MKLNGLIGINVYEVYVLYSRRDLPQPGGVLQCGEGVAVILDPARHDSSLA